MNDSLDTLSIDTPENVTFSYEVAGIGSRFLAALADTVLLGLLQVVIVGTVALILVRLMDSSTGNGSLAASDQAPVYLISILLFIAFMLFWVYYIFFESLWNGQTPGKRWVGLRVIRVDGTPIGFSDALIRNLVRTLDLLPVAYGVGVVTMFINRNSRRLGDLAARTVVVHDRPASLIQPVPHIRHELSLLYGKGPLPEGFPLEKVSEQDMQVLESFLSRRGQLANRKALAAYLLRSLCARLGLAAADPSFEEDPERALAVIYQARLGITREESPMGGAK